MEKNSKKTISFCYYCEPNITNNVGSDEHVIKKSFGGMLSSSRLLCKEHNHLLGITLDSDFSNEMDYIYDSLYNLAGGKSRIFMYDEDGNKYAYGPSFRPMPYLDIKRQDGISKREFYSPEEFDEKIKEIQSKLDPTVELVVYTPPKTSGLRYFKKDKTIVLGETCYKSFVKTAIGYFLLKQGEIKYVQHAINVLKGNVIDYKIASFFYSPLYYIPLENDEVCHFIYLRGDKDNRLLYCYIELFNTHNMLVFLNSEYDGEEIEERYCDNVIERKRYYEKQSPKYKSFSMNLSRSHYEDFKNLGLGNRPNEHQIRYDRLIDIIYKRIKAVEH